MVGNHKIMSKGYIKTESSEMVFIDVILSSIYHSKQLSPLPNSPANCVVIYSWLPAFPAEMEPFEDDLRTYRHLTNLRNKPQQNQPGELSEPILA